MRTRRLSPTGAFWTNRDRGTERPASHHSVTRPLETHMRTNDFLIKSDRGATRGVYIPGIVVVILIVLLILAIL